MCACDLRHKALCAEHEYEVRACAAYGAAGWAVWKAEGGRTSPDQDWWLHELSAAGWHVAVCFGWQQAARCIATYLGLVWSEVGL